MAKEMEYGQWWGYDSGATLILGDLRIGERFIWNGSEYVKVATEKRHQFGLTNCRKLGVCYGPPGDPGYRYIEDGHEVRRVE